MRSMTTVRQPGVTRRHLTIGPRRPARPLRAAVVASLVAGLAAALLVGCGGEAEPPSVVSVGGPTTHARGADPAEQAARYRDCLLAEGVTLLDHPTEEGLPQVDKERTTVEVLAAAQEACRALVPTGGDLVKPAPEDVEARRRYAACLRENGVPDYPDPDPVTGEPRIPDALAERMKRDPAMAAAARECERQGGPGSGKGTVGG
jgi:hypothetical protein